MKIGPFFTAILCALGFVNHGLGQVPSLINYQGRLADANGAPVTGSKNFTLSIYDGETEGSLLYSEDIGAVTLDDNGVYSFQFGESGASQATATKSVGVADGVKNVFNTVLPDSAIGVSSIGDGTYTWTPTNGSSSPTSFIGSYDGSSKTVSAIYIGGTPNAGTTITVTYKTQTTGITTALNSGSQHWLAISIDGETQTQRERILCVPFAQVSGKSGFSEVSQIALSAPSAESKASSAQTLSEIALFSAEKAKAGIVTQYTSGSWVEFFTDLNGFYDSMSTNGLRLEGDDQFVSRVYYHDIPIAPGASSGSSSEETILSNSSLRYIRFFTRSGSSSQWSPNARISGTITYSDGSTQPYELYKGYGNYSNGQSDTQYVKPDSPGKQVQRITIIGQKRTAMHVEATIWLNEPRIVTCNLPSGFVNSGESLKPIVSFKQIEEGSSVVVSLVDSNDKEYSLDTSSWTPFSGDASGELTLKITFRPNSSDSEIDHTKPEGILLLKQ